MLETAAKVNLNLFAVPEMKPLIVQIYEVQDPEQAGALVEQGVYHIGSLVVSEKQWQDPLLKETIACVRNSAAKSSLIPLFSNPDSILEMLDYYRPDIVHFCEALVGGGQGDAHIEQLIGLQKDVKKRFTALQIMRSIPIGPPGQAHRVPTLELGRRFEAVSDFFLTDTLLTAEPAAGRINQPVKGFVGITGTTCDWSMAARLVEASRIPVILAGGISPHNVREGIRRVKPYGVDSCTRTNFLDEAGRPVRFKKDLHKVRQLVEAVRKIEAESI